MKTMNQVPKAGDKIRILANKTTRIHINVGDVLEVIGGKADFFGKPGFCIWQESHYGKKRRVWYSTTAYDWEIVNDEPPLWTARDNGHVEEIIRHLTILAKDYQLNLNEEIDWIKGIQKRIIK